MEKRKCPGCGHEFELTEEYFHRDSSHKSGFARLHKKCALIQQAKARARPVHLGSCVGYDVGFGTFERTCLKEKTRRSGERIPSIYRVV